MNDQIIALDKVPPGSRFQIWHIDDSLPIKGRLKELGFRKGGVVDKLQVGFLGSPIACRVCGAVIAVRAEDAKKIDVKRLFNILT